MDEKTPVNCECLEQSGWTYLTDDGVVAHRPVRLEGFVVNSSTDAGTVTLYSGEDAGAGRLIGIFKALANVSMVQNLIPPIPCPNGIYAVLSATCENVTIFWSTT